MSRQSLVSLVLVGVLAACEGPQGAPAVDDSTVTSSASVTASDAEHQHSPSDMGGAGEALALRPIMLQLAGDMAAFTHAMWLEDYEVMAARAAAIAEHPHIAPEEVQRIQAELGTEMSAFEAADEAVHEASIRLHSAAEARNIDAVLGELATVQQGCMSCHVQFRERLRTDLAASSGQ